MRKISPYLVIIVSVLVAAFYYVKRAETKPEIKYKIKRVEVIKEVPIVKVVEIIKWKTKTVVKWKTRFKEKLVYKNIIVEKDCVMPATLHHVYNPLPRFRSNQCKTGEVPIDICVKEGKFK